MKDLLKNAREQKGLKTREVAQLLQIDQALISKFENGQRKPTREQLSKLAALLGIDFNTLLILWLKEKIIYEIGQDEFALKALQLAEEEIKRRAFTQSYTLSAALQLLLHETDKLKEKALRFKSFETEAIQQLIVLEYTYNSNLLNGSTFSLEETYAVLYKGETISGKSMREHLEVLNQQEAVRQLESLTEKGNFVSEKDILTLHSLLTRGISPESSGKYRTTDLPVNGTIVFPDYSHIPKLMADTFLWYETNKNKLHPVVLAGEILVQLQSIQPFLNGNPAVARLVMNGILLQYGYIPATIKGDAVSRQRLEAAIDEAITTKNKEALLLLIATAEKESLERYLNILVHH